MTEQPLDDRVRAAVGTRVPGVAVVVVGAEGVRARSTAGVADVISGQPMATDIAFPWFSMTKIATATTAIRLAERGVLELDAPVCALVPAMRVLRPTPWAARITARHLLQHSAEFPNPIPVTWIHPADQPGPDPDAFLQRLLAKHPRLRFQPGARSSYSNLGTLALGSAMTQAAGAPFQSGRYDLGLGWFVPNNQRNADPAFVEHLGGGAGFFNVMRIYPSRGVGVVVMGNATTYDVNAVASLALKFHL